MLEGCGEATPRGGWPNHSSAVFSLKEGSEGHPLCRPGLGQEGSSGYSLALPGPPAASNVTHVPWPSMFFSPPQLLPWWPAYILDFSVSMVKFMTHPSPPCSVPALPISPCSWASRLRTQTWVSSLTVLCLSFHLDLLQPLLTPGDPFCT